MNNEFLASLFLLLLGLFAINPVEASNLAFAPEYVSKVAKTSTGVTASTVFSAKAANQSVYDVRAVKIAKASAGNAIKKRAFTPWGFALVAAFTAAELILDENSQNITEQTSGSTITGNCTAGGNTVSNITGSSCLAIQAQVDSDFYGNDYISTFYIKVNPSFYRLYVSYNHQGQTLNGNTGYAFFPSSSVPDVNTLVGGQQPISDSEAFDIVSNQLGQAAFHDLFVNPLTGKPNPDIQEFQDTATDVSNDYNAANDGDVNTNPTVDIPNGDTGTQQQTENEPPEPDLCQKYPNILACSELDDVPDVQDIATQDIDFEYTQHTFSSNASCPGDVQLPYGVISYQPMCDYASGIKPIVLIVFSIAALFILGGFKQND